MLQAFKNKKVSFSFSIDMETLNKLQELMDRYGLDASKTIREIVKTAHESREVEK
jgi:antitoxin component of RelBE/YafQ-DinJ toxin-antitoxin module